MSPSMKEALLLDVEEGNAERMDRNQEQTPRLFSQLIVW